MQSMKHIDKGVDYKLLHISSSAFNNSENIPERYTCEGKNLNPPLSIKGIPLEAACLAVIMDDPDAPGGTWVHWLLWNIPVTHQIAEHLSIGVSGMNDFLQQNYMGPCPPPGARHRYFIKVYALDQLLDLKPGSRKSELEKAMAGHILAFGELTGWFGRNSNPRGHKQSGKFY